MSDNQERPAKLWGKACKQADELLSAARKSGDRLREVYALIDLGVVSTRVGDVHGALSRLEESLELAGRLECTELENDARVNLGLALLGTGQIERARALLEQQAVQASERGDIFHEKIALDYLAAAHVKSGAHAQARALYERAADLAKQVHDRQHEAELLWMVAIQCAELDERDRAGAAAETAIGLYKQMNNPHVACFVDSLHNYLQGAARLAPRPDTGSGAPVGGYYTGPTRQAATAGTGMLWRALAAAQSFGTFLASGFKTVSAAAHQERLKVCETCPHHTGVRCKLCGCFTSLKAWMPHENCPIGKWPRC